MARDLAYRRNQWPAGVAMVQIDRRFAALRVRSGPSVQWRRTRDGPWEPLPVVSVGRAWRPWVLTLGLADGDTLKIRPFRPGEAGLPDCGDRVGGIGDSQQLGNDPVSAVVAAFAIVFYVLASPFFVVANVKRARVARALRVQLAANVGGAAGRRVADRGDLPA